MQFDINNLTFVITGGASGIGAATAALAVANGANVVIADVDDDAGRRLAGELAGDGHAVFAHCDVTQPAQVEAAMALAHETFGSLDVLHNNAGIADAGVS